MMNQVQARHIIKELLDVAHSGALVGCQDGGRKVDIVLSRRRGHRNEVMSLEESEKRMDATIRMAYKLMTGQSVVGDPVEFINS
jgi:hypothetical protein